MAAHTTPYGIRRITITPYTDEGGTVLGTPIPLPYGRTLSFTDSEEFNELRGDDRVVAVHGAGPAIEWDLESGGLPLEAYKAMSGGVVATTGTGPTEKTVYDKTSSSLRPYFKIEGQAISDSGGDVHVLIYRAKATGELSGSFSDGEFFLTSASGSGLASEVTADAGKIYSFIHNKTAVAPTGALA